MATTSKERGETLQKDDPFVWEVQEEKSNEHPTSNLTLSILTNKDWKKRKAISRLVKWKRCFAQNQLIVIYYGENGNEWRSRRGQDISVISPETELGQGAEASRPKAGKFLPCGGYVHNEEVPTRWKGTRSEPKASPQTRSVGRNRSVRKWKGTHRGGARKITASSRGEDKLKSPPQIRKTLRKRENSTRIGPPGSRAGITGFL